MKEGKAAILANLKDPDSAKFKGLFTARDTFLCGEVNAKNSMGGYTGFQRFVTMGSPGLTWFDNGDVKFIEQWGTLCLGMPQSQIDAARGK